MLKVDQYSYVRTAHRVYKTTIKQIARESGHSKNTIKRVIRGEYAGYRPRFHQSYPALGPHLALIDKWLNDDKGQPKKQRHTAVRIYHRLRQEIGFEGSETTVRRYVREAKLRLGLSGQQAFIPCQPTLGGEAEVDWGTCYAILGGEAVRLKLFCMRSKYSGNLRGFVQCYLCERQQSFFDAHIRAFTFFHGVSPLLIYDNFEPRFCNRNAGHEKGGVEGLVGYARRNYMVPVPRAESLEALNDKLLSDCMAYGAHRIAGREQSVTELYEGEKIHLISLPEVPFSNITLASPGIDKFATVVIDKNHYSVPTHSGSWTLLAIPFRNPLDPLLSRGLLIWHPVIES